VGTIALEAALLGRHAFTSDLSPFASTIARGKVAPPNSEGLFADLNEFKKDLSTTKLDDEDFVSAEFGLNARVKDYYHPDTLKEILQARKLLTGVELSAERNFLKACILHALHGNRPYAFSRTSHPLTPFAPSGPFQYRSLFERLEKRVSRLCAVGWPEDFIHGTSWHADFRALPRLLNKPVNAVITSPPFPGMRFDRPNWLRLWFCGWGEKDFHETSRAFLERQQGKTFDVYKEFFSVCAELTVSGAPIILHVGGSKSYNMAERLKELGSTILRFKSMIIENVEHVEKHGVRDKGATSSHILLVFERA
jgi:hypothetical protein